MRSMWKYLAVLALGCAGEPFTEFRGDGISNGGKLSVPVLPAGSGGEEPGTSGRRATSPSAAAPTGGTMGASLAGDTGMPLPEMYGGNGGDGGNSGEPSSFPLCRIDGDVCQCYSDPSVFEPGWLNVTDCPASNRCTSRDSTACVCWDTEAAYTSALMNGFIAEEGCPNAK